jgi:chromatin segregation and condensation protein Rec8/ScpA/Scc1 (kleisin family)
MTSKHREAFGDRFRAMQGALKKLGTHPWNLLHHPERQALLTNLADKLDALKQAGNDFDAAIKPAKPKPTKPKPATDKQSASKKEE